MTHLAQVYERLLIDAALLEIDLRGIAHLLDDTVKNHALFP